MQASPRINSNIKLFGHDDRNLNLVSYDGAQYMYTEHNGNNFVVTSEISVSVAIFVILHDSIEENSKYGIEHEKFPSPCHTTPTRSTEKHKLGLYQ